jgi:hypothetical protein
MTNPTEGIFPQNLALFLYYSNAPSNFYSSNPHNSLPQHYHDHYNYLPIPTPIATNLKEGISPQNHALSLYKKNPPCNFHNNKLHNTSPQHYHDHYNHLLIPTPMTTNLKEGISPQNHALFLYNKNPPYNFHNNFHDISPQHYHDHYNYPPTPTPIRTNLKGIIFPQNRTPFTYNLQHEPSPQLPQQQISQQLPLTLPQSLQPPFSSNHSPLQPSQRQASQQLSPDLPRATTPKEHSLLQCPNHKHNITSQGK